MIRNCGWFTPIKFTRDLADRNYTSVNSRNDPRLHLYELFPLCMVSLYVSVCVCVFFRSTYYTCVRLNGKPREDTAFS